MSGSRQSPSERSNFDCVQALAQELPPPTRRALAPPLGSSCTTVENIRHAPQQPLLRWAVSPRRGPATTPKGDPQRRIIVGGPHSLAGLSSALATTPSICPCCSSLRRTRTAPTVRRVDRTTRSRPLSDSHGPGPLPTTRGARVASTSDQSPQPRAPTFELPPKSWTTRAALSPKPCPWSQRLPPRRPLPLSRGRPQQQPQNPLVHKERGELDYITLEANRGRWPRSLRHLDDAGHLPRPRTI